jgi:hypothetical protein
MSPGHVAHSSGRGVRAEQSDGHREGGGLAGAVRADQAKEGSGRHSQIDVVDSGGRPERLDESGELESRGAVMP